MGHTIHYYGKLKVTPEISQFIADAIIEQLHQGELDTSEAWGDHAEDWHIVNSEIYWECDSEKSYSGEVYIVALCQKLFPEYKVNGRILAFSDYHDESYIIDVRDSVVSTQNMIEILNNAPIL